jgi:hypothetical protein
LFRRTDAHTDTGIVFIFANVVFAGMSYMTYCREMIHKINAVRERVKGLSSKIDLAERVIN